MTKFFGCEHCGNFVPACPEHGRLPHGWVGGTYLECRDCGWVPDPTEKEEYEGEDF